MRIDEWHKPPLARSIDTLLEWTWSLLTDISNQFHDTARAINGSLTFGDGAEADNLRGEWVVVSSTSSPGSEITVAHSLGVVPVGAIVMVPPEFGTVNRGSTSWTSTNVYLKITSASQTATVFLVAPPESD